MTCLQKVKYLCKEKGVSVARLERDCKIGNGTVGRWDSSMPNVETLKKVANYFNVSIESLLPDEEKMSKETK